MTVKGIFKTLIGTILFSVVILLFTEYLNVSSTATFMKGMLTSSIENSCDFFAQETYKSDGASGGTINDSGNGADIKDFYGSTAISGRFFRGSGREDIYNNLYGSNSPFASWYRNGGVKGTWKNLDMLASGIGLVAPSLSSSEKEMGKSYAENMMTPLNLGVPYIDKATVERICRWNIVANFSEGRSTNIISEANVKRRATEGGAGVHQDITRLNSSGNAVNIPGYVQYKGFRIYYDSFKINNIRYKIYDLSTSSGKSAFEKLTNINAEGLYGGNIAGLAGNERAKIGVAEIEYSIDIDYVGITPVAKALNFATNVSKVSGLDDGRSISRNTTNLYRGNGARTFVNNLTGSQATPVSDKIYYYIVR